jgi:type VI secretion system protein ImpE
LEQNTLRISSENEDITKLNEDLIAKVKAEPANIELRFQLVKLYCLQADWDRAYKQLSTILSIEKEATRQVELYKSLLLSERLREQVLRGERTPCGLEGVLPEWCNDLHKANEYYTLGDFENGDLYRSKALEQADAESGSAEKQGLFSWLADGDDRIGPILEFITAGGYRWITLSEVQKISINPPLEILDMVWAKAAITLTNGIEVNGYVPARYPLTQLDTQQIKAGSVTNWIQEGESRHVGQGRKMWMTDSVEFSIFDSGLINFDRPQNA